MSRGWWRRNAVALVAVAVLAPATVTVISSTVWSDWNIGHPTHPITVDSGQSAKYSTATIGGAEAVFDDHVEGTPAGARVVAVTVRIDPHGQPLQCLTPTLRELGDAQREWSEASLDLNRPYDADRIGYCDSEQIAPYTLSLDYLVLAGASGPFSVDLATPDALPSFVRLVVEP